MTTSPTVFFLLLSLTTIFSASAFQPTTVTPSSTTAPFYRHRSLSQFPNTSPLVLYAGFEQLPGESTTDFIKRVTSQSNDLLEKQKNGFSVNKEDDEEEKPKKVGKYQRIEDWDAERNAKGELTWEEKVQFDGQRFGNQVKQDSILRRHLGSFR